MKAAERFQSNSAAARTIEGQCPMVKSWSVQQGPKPTRLGGRILAANMAFGIGLMTALIVATGCTKTTSPESKTVFDPSNKLFQIDETKQAFVVSISSDGITAPESTSVNQVLTDALKRNSAIRLYSVATSSAGDVYRCVVATDNRTRLELLSALAAIQTTTPKTKYKVWSVDECERVSMQWRTNHFVAAR